MNRRIDFAILATLCLTLIATGARADFCASPDARPAVCTVELLGGLAGQRVATIDPSRPLDLRSGQTLDIQLDALDQNRRSFPHTRLSFDFDAADCNNLVAVEPSGTGRFSLRAGPRQGECDLWIWIPGNLNLEWRLRVRALGSGQVAPTPTPTPAAPSSATSRPPRKGYSHAEAQYVARCLYQALLGREADPTGLRDTALEIQRGNLGQRTLDMLQSQEYRTKSFQVTPNALLDRFYEAILGRKADPDGVRTFVPMLQYGKPADVIQKLMTSDEFETRLRAETSG